MSQPQLVLAITVVFGGFATVATALVARSKTRAARAYAFVLFAATIAAAYVILESSLRVNFTTSVPLGIYRLESLPTNSFARGTLVVACAPAAPAEMGRRRGYLSRGACPHDTEPLLKVVAGVPGDDVAASEQGVAINGCVLPNSAPLSLDRSGRHLDAWPSGRYHLAPDQFWLYAGNLRSWDSRYWGPVTVADVKARAVPFLVLGGVSVPMLRPVLEQTQGHRRPDVRTYVR